MSKMLTLRLSERRLQRLDEAVARGDFPNRSAALSAALDRLLAAAEARAIDDAIVDGYTRVPPTADEDAAARAAARRSIAAERW